ncbi:hypothetical protein JCM10213_005900 [Rhodosporidiobolus nylandii]
MADSDGYSSASDSEQQPGSAAAGGASTSTAMAGSAAKKHKGVGGGGEKGKGKEAGKDDTSKRRSSKACDNCRKSKCKCTRNLDPSSGEPVGPCQNCIAVSAECTFNGATRKRGPPKGYIEAIESRLHRMEALLGGLLGSDDPRAQTLLGELIGDHEARDVLARDLKAAAAVGGGKPPKRSWKKEYQESLEINRRLEEREREKMQQQQQQGQGQGQVTTGFNPPPSASGSGLPQPPASAWPMGFSEEDLAAAAGVGSSLGFDPSSLPGGGAEGPSPAFSLPVPVPVAASSSYQQHNGFPPPPTTTTGTSDALSLSTSSRQRRRLDLPTAPSWGVSSSSTTSAGGFTGVVPAGSPNAGYPTSFGPSTAGIPAASPSDERRQMAYAFTLPPPGSLPPPSRQQQAREMGVLSPGAIGHTGSAHFGAEKEGEEERGKREMTELADVVGQLSLNENAEVRYHGRSSSLYLITRSARFRDFFWQFPSTGIWPPSDDRILKTEREILRLSPSEDPLPPMEVQSQLLQAYWTYVHPHFPLLYKITFLRQYRHGLAHPDSDEPSRPSGTGKVPMVLLLSMFALAARYCDLEGEREEGKYWTAGQEYLEKARQLLNHDYGSSKLVLVQSLLLISYREIGVGAMSSAWMTAGMAIRMAQDLGLFRDVEKWYLPTQRFTHEEKQTRKRVWWACVIIDRYTSSYIGRPGTIHERDYDTAFPSEDEPDEHEQWRPTRLDGTEWTAPPKAGSDFPPEEVAKVLRNYPPCKANTMSCFNAAGALAVIINRIISNIYAIRIRVLGQSSETLLSLLDQSLASWYLALPPHLQYNPAGTKVPPPHILALHLQFYSSLILLHRPFIPGQNSTASLGNFPSHSICTTSANAIANIITVWRQNFTLRQCPPFLTYPIFSAAIICVYNASFDDALARPAKVRLAQCMSALKEMELIWGSAMRAWELLHGLVDLHDADLNAELVGLSDEANRGTKRPAMDVDEPSPSSFADVRPANFHHQSRPAGARAPSKPAQARRRSSTSGSGVRTSRPSNPSAASPTLPQNPQLYAPPPPVPVTVTPGGFSLQSPPPFNFPTPAGAPVMPSSSSAAAVPPPNGGFPTAQSFDILNPNLDLNQFKPDGGATNFSDLLNSFLSPTEAASSTAAAGLPPSLPSFAAAPGGGFPSTATSPPGAADPLQNTSFDPTAAFFGMPLGADMTEDWFNYLYNPSGAEQGGAGVTPESSAGGSAAPGGATAPRPPVI